VPADAVDDQDEALAAEQAALAASPASVVDLAGRVAGLLPSGAALAGWLTTVSPDHCSPADLAGLAVAYRRLASWAQAGELAAVAAVASRFAADNERIGVDENGRPRQVPPEAAAQVGLALNMGKTTAADWTHLGVQLRWQLPDTAAALSGGSIDLLRARLIAEATAMLTDEAASSVEDRVLPEAGQQTCAQLRSTLRRALIAADPDGAEQRRKDAERRAKVSLYSDDDGAATLAGSSLPGVHAAAAMARITAMARALKASGANGGLDLLRANIFLGLLLGTMPLIPPADGGPPDEPQPSDGGPPDEPQPSDGGPPDEPQPSDGGPPDQPQPSDGGPPDQPQPADGGPPDQPQPADDTPPDESRSPDDATRREATPSDDAPAPSEIANAPEPTEPACCWPDIPPPGDDDAPLSDDSEPPDPQHPPVWSLGRDIDDEEPPGDGPPPPWPALPATIPAAGFLARKAGSLRPHPGLLDAILPWSALVGFSSEPGVLGRIGPVTTTQSRELLRLAMSSRDTEWRLILTDDDGRARAVERIRLGRSSSDPPRAGPAAPGPASPGPHAPRSARAGPDTAGPVGAGTDAAPTTPGPTTTAVVGRATLTMRESWLAAHAAAPDSGLSGRAFADQVLSGKYLPGTTLPDRRLLLPVLRAAKRAAARVEAEREANAQAASGCAHSTASAAYTPPPRIREFVAARDVTCRFPPCGQPAWRLDLDHTVPWQRGGPTCSCNLGGACRTHHQVKQLPGWKLEQPRPGYFIWTTPAGLTYRVSPDRYPV